MIRVGDCLEVMALLDASSVDSVVTDPPYGLSFMGKAWDHGVPGEMFWVEALRVAKPGAYLLAFGGTRTFHRLMVAIEDSGWEIRDTIMWVYGSGFPKSLDVSKSIDKAAGVEREVVGKQFHPTSKDRSGGKSPYQAEDCHLDGSFNITAPATESAQQWQGWGTALKPAWEPIIVARKPLIGTVAKNIHEHGTGGLNIDGCRIPSNGDKLGGGRISTTTDGWDRPWKHDAEAIDKCRERGDEAVAKAESLGRWPANLIHDGSDEVLAGFPQSAGAQGNVQGTEPSNTGGEGTNCYGEYGRVASQKRGDSGSAARFFYCAKASKSDRTMNGQVDNKHPTVKPNALMRYLCKLVTPQGGLVLDPFCGSGSTGVAAVQEGFRFMGIEKDEDSAATARDRIKTVMEIGTPCPKTLLD